MLRYLKTKNIKSIIIMYLFKTMVTPLYKYVNAARAKETNTDLNKIRTEQTKAIRLASHLSTLNGRA